MKMPKLAKGKKARKAIANEDLRKAAAIKRAEDRKKKNMRAAKALRNQPYLKSN